MLDIGAGLADPGCRVECLDLLQDFCDAGRLLNQLIGLASRVVVHTGSALDMPFPAEVFDVVWMQNVGMNIADKRRLSEEILRVLRRGGRSRRWCSGAPEASYFPLPWATTPAENSLVTADAMATLLTQCGFEAVYFVDVSEEPLPPLDVGTPEEGDQAPLSLSVFVEKLAEKADNAARSLRERQIRLYRGVSRTA